MSQKHLSNLFSGCTEAALKRRDWLENTSAAAGLYTEFLQTFVSPAGYARALQARPKTIEFSLEASGHNTEATPTANRQQPAKCRMHDGHSCNLHEIEIFLKL